MKPNVIPIRPKEPPGAEALLRDALALLITVAIEHRERIAELEARLPPPRFGVPAGWINAKDAALVCGYSLPSIYRMVRTGHVVGVKFDRLMIDPATLPARK